MNKLTDSQFEKFCSLIYSCLGISFNDAKRTMIQSKLNKLMNKVNIQSYDEYYKFILNDNSGKYWNQFVDEITIHKTDFFREDYHFEFISKEINSILDNNPRIMENREIRVWSSACSTGEEAYTIAMVLKECLPDGVDIKILATDVSKKVVSTAQTGFYTFNDDITIKPYYLSRYFELINGGYSVIPSIKSLVTFRTFNLMDPFPFKNGFDMIFSRNVMIYFDFDVQKELVEKYYNALVQGGILFIGHSESLVKKQHKFVYLQPTIYIK